MPDWHLEALTLQHLDRILTIDRKAFVPLVILIFRKKDGGISVVAKKRSAIGTFF